MYSVLCAEGIKHDVSANKIVNFDEKRVPSKDVYKRQPYTYHYVVTKRETKTGILQSTGNTTARRLK